MRSIAARILSVEVCKRSDRADRRDGSAGRTAGTRTRAGYTGSTLSDFSRPLPLLSGGSAGRRVEWRLDHGAEVVTIEAAPAIGQRIAGAAKPMGLSKNSFQFCDEYHCSRSTLVFCFMG